MTATDDTRINALIIRPSSHTVEPQRIQPDLDLYQRIVGGNITSVDGRTDGGQTVIFYVNDDGIAEQLPVNVVATALWRFFNPNAANEFLLGAVIVVGGENPEDADVPERVIRRARHEHRQADVNAMVAQLREQAGEP
jgi:hypothetical protein